jgi:hypothetical protein
VAQPSLLAACLRWLQHLIVPPYLAGCSLLVKWLLLCLAKLVEDQPLLAMAGSCFSCSW